MTFTDLLHLTISALSAHKARSALTGLGIAIGVAAVVLLTSIGEGVRHYILTEFTQFGTHLIAINPGRTTTMGTPVGTIASARPLTLLDAEALESVRGVEAIVPFVQGNAQAKYGAKHRRTNIYGVGPEMPGVFQLAVASGHFLPPDNPRTARAFAVLGAKITRELFPGINPLGRHLRIDNSRFTVIGTMASKGQVLGFDLDDAIYIPAGRAQELFNRNGLMEVDVLYREDMETDTVAAGLRRLLIARHGQDDFTLTTQAQMLETLGSILGVLTFAVGALGGISLLVGGVGILTILTITVRERIGEIGLLRALGATHAQVLLLFLSESVILAGLGGVAGLVIGIGGAAALHALAPGLPVHTPWYYVALSETIALTIGLLSGVLPARHAARMNPVDALRAE